MTIRLCCCSVLVPLEILHGQQFFYRVGCSTDHTLACKDDTARTQRGFYHDALQMLERPAFFLFVPMTSQQHQRHKFHSSFFHDAILFWLTKLFPGYLNAIQCIYERHQFRFCEGLVLLYAQVACYFPWCEIKRIYQTQYTTSHTTSRRGGNDGFRLLLKTQQWYCLFLAWPWRVGILSCLDETAIRLDDDEGGEYRHFLDEFRQCLLQATCFMVTTWQCWMSPQQYHDQKTGQVLDFYVARQGQMSWRKHQNHKNERKFGGVSKTLQCWYRRR